MPIPLVMGLASGFAVVLLAGWFLHPRRAPMTAQGVQAVPHEGLQGQLSVHATGTDATHAVRIEPHPGAATTTIREVGP